MDYLDADGQISLLIFASRLHTLPYQYAGPPSTSSLHASVLLSYGLRTWLPLLLSCARASRVTTVADLCTARYIDPISFIVFSYSQYLLRSYPRQHSSILWIVWPYRARSSTAAPPIPS